MDVNLEILKNTMIANTRKNSVLANNLANINTNGYKRDVVFLEVLNEKSKTGINVETDFSQGQLKQTDNPLDLAISGKGFFTIETEEGESYTRDGHFSVGADGILRTSNGDPVLGKGGWISIAADDRDISNISVTSLGDIYVNNSLVAVLQIVDFDSYSDLKKMGHNLYAAQENSTPNVIDEPTVLQGNLEGSNVNPIHEMVNLIELQRQFEGSQRAIQSIDRALGKAVNNISR